MAQPPSIIALESTPPPPTVPGGVQVVQWTSDGGFPVNRVAGYVGAAGTNPYDVVFSLPGQPQSGTTFEIIPFSRAVSFLANFSGAVGRCLNNPTATAVFTLKKLTVGNVLSSIGTISIATSGAYTFASTGGAAFSFAIGDALLVSTPGTNDATLTDVAFTLPGLR